jgi:hypothetical protein
VFARYVEAGNERAAYEASLSKFTVSLREANRKTYSALSCVNSKSPRPNLCEIRERYKLLLSHARAVTIPAPKSKQNPNLNLNRPSVIEYVLNEAGKDPWIEMFVPEPTPLLLCKLSGGGKHGGSMSARERVGDRPREGHGLTCLIGSGVGGLPMNRDARLSDAP